MLLAALLMAGLPAAQARALPVPGDSQQSGNRQATAELATACAPFPKLVSVAQDVMFADLDRNGQPDLITIGAYDDSLAVLLNPGGGVVCGEAIQIWPVGVNTGLGNDLPRALVAADFDGDRRMDVAVVCSGHPPESAVPEAWKRSSVSIYLGRPGGDLVLSQHVELPSPSGRIAYAASIVSGDVDGNGTKDLVVGNRRGNSFTVLRGDGYGRFLPLAPVTLPDANQGPRALDLFSNGRQQRLLILTEQRLYEAVPSRLAPFGWTISTPVVIPRRNNSEFTSLARGDFNANGKWDVAVGDAAGGIILITSWGDFSPSRVPQTVYRPEFGEVISLAAGDWRGLGRDDLVIADHLSGRLVVWDAAGAGEVARYQPSRRPRKVIMYDWTRRGTPDIVVADEGEAYGYAGPEIVCAPNPVPVPNGLSVRGPDPATPIQFAPDLGLVQGLEVGTTPDQFWVAAPDRGAVVLVQAPAPGHIQRTPTILARWNPGNRTCWYPTDIALDHDRSELLVTVSGSNRIWRFGLDGQLRGEIIPSSYSPGNSGWWGVAVRTAQGGGAPTYLLAAPDRRMIVEITREGTLRRLISTNELPALDLAYDPAQDQVLATHPRLAGFRRFFLGGTLFLAEPPDLAEGSKEPPKIPTDSMPIVRLSDLGVKRTDGIAAHSPPDGQQKVTYLLTDGHIAEWVEGAYTSRRLDPRLLLLEGNPAALARDHSLGCLLLSIGRPFPAVAEFTDGASLGILWGISDRAEEGEPFDPGPLTVDPQTHEIFIANRSGDRLLRLGWPSRVPLVSEEISGAMALDLEDSPAVGLVRDPLQGALYLVYSSTMVPVASPMMNPSPPFPPRRFSRTHPITSAAEDAGGRMNFFSASDGWLISLPPAPSPAPVLTSIFPFIQLGKTPFSVIPSLSENRLFFSLDGQSDPLALLLGDLSAASTSWHAYE